MTNDIERVVERLFESEDASVNDSAREYEEFLATEQETP